MIGSITIGQYYPSHSYIHKLDPRVKLMAVFVFITMLFLSGNIWSYMMAATAVVVVVYASGVPPVYLLKGLRGIFYIIFFTVALNIFFTPGENVLLAFWGIKVTSEGLIMAGKMALRLVLLITGSSLLTLTTSPIALTDAIEYFLKPFRVIGVPSHEIAMMMTIALRFIPTLLEEVDKIMKAQIARGADFDTGGLIKKAKGLIPLLVPLFVSAIRRAMDLAMAMEARCYRGDVNRTKMKELKLYPGDYKALAYIGVFSLIILLLRFI